MDQSLKNRPGRQETLRGGGMSTGRRRGAGCLVFAFGLSLPVLLGCLGLLLMPAPEEDTDLGERLGALAAAWRGVKPEPEVVVEIREKIVEVEVEKLVPGPPPPPPPPPSKWVPRKEIDTATLYNGLVTKTSLVETEGGTASMERVSDGSYGVEIAVKVTIPRPATTLAEFARINPDLPRVLPGFPVLLETAATSGFYHQLYDNKRKRIQRDYSRLNRVLDRHNFYDCESILELKSPATGRRALLIQSEMDVVSDGTDGDRMPDLDAYIANSANFQPSTGYMWKKKTAQPNPLLSRYTDAIARDEALLKKPGTSAVAKQTLEAKLDINRRIANDLRVWSYLIAEADPFIVIPLSIVQQRRNSPFAPQVGDYAVVIHGGRLFPTIVGDVGPTYKAGEASLRLCKEINPQATVYSRPESDLHVTYLYFPGTADSQRDAPDLERWHQRCGELLEEIGGVGEGVELHRWKDWFAPEPIEEVQATPLENGAEGSSPASGEEPQEPAKVP